MSYRKRCNKYGQAWDCLLAETVEPPEPIVLVECCCGATPREYVSGVPVSHGVDCLTCGRDSDYWPTERAAALAWNTLQAKKVNATMPIDIDEESGVVYWVSEPSEGERHQVPAGLLSLGSARKVVRFTSPHMWFTSTELEAIARHLRGHEDDDT